MKLTALIVARNEEDKIEDCLKSLKFTDEVVLVLDRNTDRTDIIARKFTKKIFKGTWICEAERRNYGINKCKSDWILEIDADEIISPKLSNEIKEKISLKNSDFFYIPIINYVGVKVIKYGWMACLAPDGKFCLFKKGKKKWIKGSVHPSYSINGLRGSKIKEQILHFMSKNISDLINRFNRNTSLYSLDLKNEKKSLKKLLSIRKIFSRFFKSYIKRMGFRNGKIGVLISILCALYPYVSAKKVLSERNEINF